MPAVSSSTSPINGASQAQGSGSQTIETRPNNALEADTLQTSLGNANRETCKGVRVAVAFTETLAPHIINAALASRTLSLGTPLETGCKVMTLSAMVATMVAEQYEIFGDRNAETLTDKICKQLHAPTRGAPLALLGSVAGFATTHVAGVMIFNRPDAMSLVGYLVAANASNAARLGAWLGFKLGEI